MLKRSFAASAAAVCIIAITSLSAQPNLARAQSDTADQASAAAPDEAATPLTSEELEVLVARIALYPDDLVAVIVSSSLYPLQIVQAQRYLDQVKSKPSLKPDENWDGSVVSLMNYPDIVKMMSDDLGWTQELGEAITNQQKDVLEAIQQLRDKAVAEGIIKSDDKVKVVQENDTVVIQPASPEVIYVPHYQPEMLYEPDYAPAPITYAPEPYPYYYSPVAPYFAGFVTGAIWGSVVDWNDWGVWGGNGNWGNDVDIDCNNCFNNRDFNGRVNINDVDWRNVDRSKIKFDKNQLNKLDRNSFRNSIESDTRNSLKNRSADLKKTRQGNLPSGKGRQVNDVRKSTLEGLKNKPGDKTAGARDRAGKSGQNLGGNAGKPGDRAANRPSGGKVNRPVGKAKPAARPDTRAKKPSPMGDITRGRDANAFSDRGSKSRGGGMNRGGGGAPKVKRRPGGGGGGGRGGGGRRR